MPAADPAQPTLLQLVSANAGPNENGFAAAPEHLFVSALLDSGQYTPRTWGVPPSAIHGLVECHRFCCDYQDQAGCAPPLALVTGRYPSFVYTPAIHPAWAAHEVMAAETNRTLRIGMGRAAHAVAEEAYPEAVGILRETVAKVTTANRPGTDMTDFSGTREMAARNYCPVPPGRLASLTGGHGAGQLWLVAALWGVGKTFKLVEHAVAAAEAGWDVVFFSLEMHVQDILARLRSQALAHHGLLAAALSIDQQEEAVGHWSAGKGHVQVRGPDAGRLDISVIAGAVAHERTLVIVDYVGKMFASDGRHATAGHEVAAAISKELAMQAGLLGIPILGAAQVNRQGTLAQTISLEQDADLILEQRRVSPKVNRIRQNFLVKSRHTALIPSWWSRFDPVAANFEDLPGNVALQIRLAEEAEYTF